jgi:hypothetical protein
MYARTRESRAYQDAIGYLLEGASISILKASEAPKPHIGASILMPGEHQNLRVIYEYGFASSDRDRLIRLPIGTGSAGLAWLRGTAIVWNLQEPNADFPNWGIPNDEFGKIRPTVKSSLSIPIRGGQDYKILAILSFDSDNTADEIRFLDPEIQTIGYSFAASLGSILEMVS